jgi:cytochrome oxidase assembly protein ShyY1
VKNWRFALNSRWFTYLFMAVIFSVACALLSQWQFTRNAQTETQRTLVTANYNAAPVPLSQLLRRTTSYSPNQIWRTVSLVGRYVPSRQLLVRDRSYGANPGFEVLVPLKLSDGSYFVVDRGWVAVGSTQDRPDYVPPAPTGTVHVEAWLQGSESVLPGRTAPHGEISEINLPTVAKTLHGATYTGAYGLLAKETPAPSMRPAIALKPVIDPGPYLSYAIQWILFALFSFTALALALRNEYRVRHAEDPEEIARATERARRAALKDPKDSDVEDRQLAPLLPPVVADPHAVGAVVHDAELREKLSQRYGTAIVPRVKVPQRAADEDE